MEITIKINGRFVSVEVSAEVADYLEQAKRNNRKLYRERQRYWDGRECDEYIISTESRLPYCATPEELVCQRETLDEILAVLARCTPTQRERFCSTRCTISAMRRLPRWRAVPRRLSIRTCLVSIKPSWNALSIVEQEGAEADEKKVSE
mgnify:CR=1 FL=1